MNTTQLECFIKTAYTLNFNAAAEQLNMSQPAISKQIQSLENELGTRLFERTTRNVKLTVIGQNFLEDAESILKSIHKSKQKIHEFGRREKYALRIGYSDTNELPVLSEIFEKIMKKYPNIYPELHMNATDINLNELENGNIDALLAVDDKLKTGENISFIALGNIRLLCAVSGEHQLAHKTITNLNELSEHPQIMFFPYSSVHNSAKKGVLRPTNPMQPLYVCTSSTEAYTLAATGIGYALIPSVIKCSFNHIVFLEVEDTPVKQFGIYYNKDKIYPALKMFFETAKQCFFKTINEQI